MTTLREFFDTERGYHRQDGHYHPIVERFAFIRRRDRPGWYVHDDDGRSIGFVERFSQGWRGQTLGGHWLLRDDGSRRAWRRRQDAAYGLLCFASGCIPA